VGLVSPLSTYSSIYSPAPILSASVNAILLDPEVTEVNYLVRYTSFLGSALTLHVEGAVIVSIVPAGAE